MWNIKSDIGDMDELDMKLVDLVLYKKIIILKLKILYLLTYLTTSHRNNAVFFPNVMRKWLEGNE